MKQKIDPMITSWIQSPGSMLDAKRAINQWEILRGRVERKPNPAQAIGRRQQLVIDDIGVIIPDEPAIPCRPIREDRHSYQHQSKDAGTTGERKKTPSDFLHKRRGNHANCCEKSCANSLHSIALRAKFCRLIS